MTQANEENQKAFVDRYLEEGMKIDYWWMDAGWYPCGGEWVNTGTWEPDPSRFPHGLRAVSDHARAKGIKTIVWFEPERVGDANSRLAKNHPEWLLSKKAKTPSPPAGGGFGSGPRSLLNLGNPEEWTVLRMAETVRRLAGAEVPIVREPLPVDDPMVRQPDIALATSRLGWEPRVGTDDGIRETVEDFRRRVT